MLSWPTLSSHQQAAREPLAGQPHELGAVVQQRAQMRDEGVFVAGVDFFGRHQFIGGRQQHGVFVQPMIAGKFGGKFAHAAAFHVDLNHLEGTGHIRIVAVAHGSHAAYGKIERRKNHLLAHLERALGLIQRALRLLLAANGGFFTLDAMANQRLRQFVAAARLFVFHEEIE